ncbi:RdgB/HAM1 family non-canonical purine NTP pyrophosphatase [Meiothermus ruber]|jgi:XTP/dITP diphosphohydrolase|uniref:dITP/XTP pyrophosphatase n=1 Tax=Meiothermus ruber (strain ATCC 35948 / DSM 1279 / VKM B-1258 / 21) TaxID=504728 RepID=D3PQY6_MEIRD|nr:RdgB/HAM1 family non-canonical purine NTP pyrophosphatase [Meiothermus ruber]ADD27869.1 non-canonical purine NTP pyrophosphatase, rdgB/HAM1 family [Meiothermus ruber DSM 1279]AGK04336.1 dITP/XTP pyrophosphatase [Meiothermus ruber DSM 1279]MCL6530422.1 RdgB/HAM1 family non-canonical purine NTP pyrophosphatase [Meiothermus ruber]GAO74804.1 non-canonical purine NTP pyrophosphatase rdgB/HAM1 family [Meiothermus ruber H328]
MHLLIATSNPGKFREIREGLAPLGWTLFSLLDYPFKLPPEEGSTFEDNAVLKAAFAAKHSGLPTLADDSGLEVAALGGEPGVYSARYGNKSTDTERNVYLLERLKGVPRAERKARFVAVLVMAYPDGYMELYRGETEGEILEAPRGEWGFGYDPLFYLPEAGKTFAEMTLEEKAAYSHRGKALRQLLEAHKLGRARKEQPLQE